MNRETPHLIGAAALASTLGDWPSFENAEIIRVLLRRDRHSSITIRVVEARGVGVAVTFTPEQILHLSVDGDVNRQHASRGYCRVRWVRNKGDVRTAGRVAVPRSSRVAMDAEPRSSDSPARLAISTAAQTNLYSLCCLPSQMPDTVGFCASAISHSTPLDRGACDDPAEYSRYELRTRQYVTRQ